MCLCIRPVSAGQTSPDSYTSIAFLTTLVLFQSQPLQVIEPAVNKRELLIMSQSAETEMSLHECSACLNREHS